MQISTFLDIDYDLNFMRMRYAESQGLTLFSVLELIYFLCAKSKVSLTILLLHKYDAN